jgi:hypothetical protein
MRSRNSGEADRSLNQAAGQVAERGVPETPRDAALNDQRPRGGENQLPPAQQQQFAGGGQQQQMLRQQPSFARNGQAQEPPPAASQQQVALTPMPAQQQQQQQQLPSAPALANVANNNGVTAGRVYRAVLTQRQLRDLNTRLQSEGNQWTEFRGAVATDAIEGNPLANALTNSTASKELNESLSVQARKLKAELTPATTQPSAIATTLPAIVAPAGPAFGDHAAADAKGFSLGSSATQPTTNPAAAADRESLREVLIVVNDQPIDVGGGLSTATPSTHPTAGAAAAQTQPAAAPAKAPAPASTTPDPRP